MVQQQVALVEDREQVGLLHVGEHVDRLQRRIAQLVEARQLRERHQHAQIERSRTDVDVLSA